VQHPVKCFLSLDTRMLMQFLHRQFVIELDSQITTLLLNYEQYRRVTHELRRYNFKNYFKTVCVHRTRHTSGCSLTGIRSFSDKLTTGPEGSGNITGSLLMTCCCKMLSRTRLISAHAHIEFASCRLIKQEAQLSQRDRSAGWVSYGQKWKTGTGRQYLRTFSTPDSKLIFSTNLFLSSSSTFPPTGLTPRSPGVFCFSRACRF